MPGSRSLMFDDGSDERLIIRELDEVRAYLRELFGVDEKPFLRAERMGWLEWANRSDFDSPSFPGTLLWGHTVRHERAYFVQHEDWKKDNTGMSRDRGSPEAIVLYRSRAASLLQPSSPLMRP